jgi:hypothetical protein
MGFMQCNRGEYAWDLKGWKGTGDRPRMFKCGESLTCLSSNTATLHNVIRAQRSFVGKDHEYSTVSFIAHRRYVSSLDINSPIVKRVQSLAFFFLFSFFSFFFWPSVNLALPLPRPLTSLHPISLWITGLKRAHTTIQKHTQNGLPNHPSYA